MPDHLYFFSPTLHYSAWSLRGHREYIGKDMWTQTCGFSAPRAAAAFGPLFCAQAGEPAVPAGAWLWLLWLFLLFRTESKEQADEQMSRGLGFLPSCRPASLSRGVNLHSIALALPVMREQLGLRFGGQAVGMAHGAETGAGAHGEGVTPMSLSYAAREEMVSCQLEQSPGAVLLHRQQRKAASLPVAFTAVLLSRSYFHFRCMPSLRLQGFFCSDL